MISFSLLSPGLLFSSPPPPPPFFELPFFAHSTRNAYTLIRIIPFLYFFFSTTQGPFCFLYGYICVADPFNLRLGKVQQHMATAGGVILLVVGVTTIIGSIFSFLLCCSDNRLRKSKQQERQMRDRAATNTIHHAQHHNDLYRSHRETFTDPAYPVNPHSTNYQNGPVCHSGSGKQHYSSSPPSSAPPLADATVSSSSSFSGTSKLSKSVPHAATENSYHSRDNSSPFAPTTEPSAPPQVLEGIVVESPFIGYEK